MPRYIIERSMKPESPEQLAEVGKLSAEVCDDMGILMRFTNMLHESAFRLTKSVKSQWKLTPRCSASPGVVELLTDY